MPPVNTDQLASRANFVFEGTVQKARAATMAAVPVNEGTLVVRVDQMIHSPEAFQPFAGKDITVQFAAKPKLGAGDKAMFFTNGWLFGSSIAVQAIGTAPLGAPTAKLRSAALATGDPVENRDDVQIRDRFGRADLVVSGRVVAIQLPPEAEEGISEHAPVWKDATVQVDGTFKGASPSERITVRFPASEDVRWYDSPKFHVGQEGYFLLQKKEFKRRGAGAATAGELYTALSPYDYQNPTEPGGIKKLIATRRPGGK